MRLFDQFVTLDLARSPTDLCAFKISDARDDFIAKSTDGSPVFLLADASERRYVPGVNFRKLTAHFHTTCSVRTGAGRVTRQFALVGCEVDAPELHELFVQCFGEAARSLSPEAGTEELSACIQKLVDLFESLTETSDRAATGIWAELFVIAHATSVSAAVEAWHADPRERLDFSWKTSSIEVKATTQTARIHHFSLEQIMTSGETTGRVASLLLQPLSGGKGILDIANEIESSLQDAPQLREKLWQTLARTLGSDFSRKLDKRFDVGYAERHFKLFAVADIPRPPHPTDSRVTEVRFTADLTGLESSLRRSSLSCLADLF